MSRIDISRIACSARGTTESLGDRFADFERSAVILDRYLRSAAAQAFSRFHLSLEVKGFLRVDGELFARLQYLGILYLDH